MTTLDCALAWQAAGYSVVAVRADGSKVPEGLWRQRIQQRASKIQVEEWFLDGHPGLGLVCGAVSGGLEMLEFEGRAVEAGKLAELQNLATAAGLDDLVTRVCYGYSERTPSGGLHFLYRVSDAAVPGNTKLAKDADGLVLAETRGEGGYVIIAPSNGSTHPTGLPWVTLVGDATTVPNLTMAERDALHRLVRCLDEGRPPPEGGASHTKAAIPVPSGGGGGPEPPPTSAASTVGPLGSSPGTTGVDCEVAPGDDFEHRTTWADVLQPAGWELVFSRGNTGYWRRPGKTTGISATTGHADDRDRLFVFSSSTPFVPEQPYTRFAAYALLDFGGDFSAAAGSLRGRGYGSVPADAPPLTPLARPLGASLSAEQAPVPVDLRDLMRARLYDRDALDFIPAPEPLIADVLDVATIAVLAGKFGTYKTFVSVAWACSIATGMEWFGHAITKPGRVLYVAGEGGNALAQRIRAWELGNTEGERIPRSSLMVYDGRINLSSGREVEVLGEFIADIAPRLVVIDTLHRCAPGVDEDNAKEMSLVLDVAVQLREMYSTTILFNHHTGHSGLRSRGTSSIEDDADTCWVIKLDGDPEDRSATNPRVLSHRKAKNSVLCDDTTISLATVEVVGSAYVEQAPTQTMPGGMVVPGLVTLLDTNDVPRGIGYRQTRDFGTALGQKHGNATWLAVANFRKQLVEDGESS